MKHEVIIAKNYLTAEKLSILNRMVSTYLEIAEIQALNRMPMYFVQITEKIKLRFMGLVKRLKAAYDIAVK